MDDLDVLVTRRQVLRLSVGAAVDSCHCWMDRAIWQDWSEPLSRVI
jgi:hypothetical protein